MLRTSPGAHDGPVLVLDRLEGSALHAAPSGYFAAVATTDALRAEWEREGFGPLRARAHELAGPDPLRNGHGRAAAIGVAAAGVRDGRVLLGRRREAWPPTRASGTWLPSGMVEPGARIEDQVRRELDGGARRTGRPARPLGVGFDLRRLRAELCWTLELHSDEVELGEEFVEASWIDPEARWPDPLTPAAAAVLALLLAGA